MEHELLPEEMKRELSVMLRQYLNNPPYLDNQEHQAKLAELLAGSPAGIIAARFLVESLEDWIKLTGKVVMTYALLGVTVKEGEGQSEFVKKLWEE